MPSRSADPEQLRIRRLRALRGPNFWRLAPVIACDLSLGDLEGVSSAEMSGFTDRLLAALPTLHEHPCSRPASGGFVERLQEGTHLPHILEHVALELQTLAGPEVGFGRVVPSGDAGVWWLIVAYEEEEVGLASVREGVRLLQACMAGEPFAIDDTVAELSALYERVRLGPSTGAIVHEAERRGIPVRRLNHRSLVQLGLGIHLRRIQAAVTDGTSNIAVEIAQDKDETRRVLENVGLPVPRGATALSADDATERAEEMGYPVILKPLNASHGRGISGRLDDAAAVLGAWPVAAEYGKRVVVERFVVGRDHRILVVDGKFVAASERVPAHVRGDGTHTVAELIAEENRNPLRGTGHTKSLTRIPADARTAEFLAGRGWTLDSVPPAGETIALRATANLSTGGTATDRTDEIHPDNVTACEMAAGVVGLDIAGIDVLSPDISVPFRENGATIIEVNAGPGLRMHTHPSEGKPRSVAAPIVDMLYPPGAPFSIPVIAVTGTNGKTTTTRLIAHLYRNTGSTVGFTTTDGVYLGNRLVMAGDMTGPFSANIILSNPTVEVAVLETARGGLLRAGLGFSEADVGVVLNVSGDHLGVGGINTVEQLAELKSVVAAVVRREGHAVLNADDPLTLAMAERTEGDVVLFSTRPEGSNPEFEAHLARGGIAARIEDGAFVVRRGRLRIPIATAAEVPLMMGGAARFQAGNVLAAIAAAYVRGMRYDDIRAGLLSFFPSAALTPGRLNVVRVGRGRVVLDYAHNSAAIAGLMEFVHNLDARRRIGVITGPGDRRDDDLRNIGRLCAGLDHVIVKEDQHRRGRAEGEIADLVVEGLHEGGMTEDRIERIYAEPRAMARALELLGENDLVVSLIDDVPAVLEQIQPVAAGAGGA